MGTVRIVETDSVAWQRVHEAVSPDVSARMSEAERNGDVRILHPGSGGELQLFEANIAPNDEVSLHAHEADEIIYILEGELQIGRKRLGPGASVFIAGQTLYGFKAGPSGVRFLNFRGEANTSFITREEFMANKPARRA
ncbi:MAG: quercetin dioxygenase-like cupin family protein [Gammaproteobacteria bacterium]|jgi:quercetin dioxygenase-like cupin family protein